MVLFFRDHPLSTTETVFAGRGKDGISQDHTADFFCSPWTVA
jgi:hypothetical protein